MKKINPNSFVTFNCHAINGNSNFSKIVEMTLPWKSIHSAERCQTDSQKTGYWLRVMFPGLEKYTTYQLDEKTYNELKRELPRIDFSIPIIETVEQIRDAVKEEINKTKRVHSAISSLQVGEEA